MGNRDDAEGPAIEHFSGMKPRIVPCSRIPLSTAATLPLSTDPVDEQEPRLSFTNPELHELDKTVEISLQARGLELTES